MKCQNVGRLRHRIIIQNPVGTANNYGGRDIEWTDFATIWSWIRPLSGAELMFAGRLENDVTHKIRIRYRSDIEPKMRIKYGTRLFEIHSILTPDEYTQWMDLMAVEKKPDYGNQAEFIATEGGDELVTEGGEQIVEE